MGRDRRSAGRLSAVVVALALLVSAIGSVAAQPVGDKERARKHYQRAEAFRQAGAHADAIREYEAAYAVVPRPGFLFNIALSYEALGERAKAITYYDRFLAAGGEGDTAAEALARKTQLERAVQDEQAKAKTAAAAEAKRREAGERAARAATLDKAGKHAEAAVELRAAHALAGDPELLFALGEALRAAGQPKEALIAFERYRREAPGGARAGDAIERIATLERTIGDAARADDPAAAPSVDAPSPGRGPAATDDAAPRASGTRRWVWLGLAAAAVGGAIVLDNAPDSARNGQLDGLDVVPVGLYSVGTALIIRGVF